VAYLLDAYQTKAADVDALLWTCLRSWGGRLSPILPFTDGSLPDAAWALLRAVSPDVISSPSPIPEELSSRLQVELSPVAIQPRALLLSPVHTVVNSEILEDIPPRGRPKVAISFRLLPSLTDPLARRFIEWNFGHFLPGTANGVPTKEHSVGSLDDLRRALQERAEYRGHEIYQPEIASVPDTLPCVPAATDNFTVVVGDSVSDFCTAWNAALCKGKGGRLSSVWIPLALAEDPDTAPILKHWIAYASSRLTNSPRVLLQAADPKRSEDLAALLLPAHSATHSKPCPPPEPEYFGDVLRASEIVHRGLQDEEVIILRSPESWQTTGIWAADLVIEQESFDPNYLRTWWWQLPRSPAVAGRVLQQGRVNSSHRLPTTLVQAERPEILVRLPDSAELFRALLCPRNATPTGRGGFQDCRLSDKGRCLESFVELLGGLLAAKFLVESRFWREVLKEMPEVTAPSGTEWTYKDLLGKASREYNDFKRVHSRTDEFDREIFKGSVENLIERGVFILGMDQRCASCDYTTWFSLGTLRQSSECPGCHVLTAVDPSRPIRIRLNSLVKRGWQQDIVPVLLALESEVMHSRTSFRYSPQMDVFDEDPGRNALTDIDILCVTDGDLVIGEAKTDINGFGEKDFTNLRMCAERLRPDRIVLFSMTGDASSDFEAQLAALRAAVALHGVRETLWRRPMPSVFEATPPH
jgi:hypothetical protein